MVLRFLSNPFVHYFDKSCGALLVLRHVYRLALAQRIAEPAGDVTANELPSLAQDIIGSRLQLLVLCGCILWSLTFITKRLLQSVVKPLVGTKKSSIEPAP
jgi:hypothetical protein